MPLALLATVSDSDIVCLPANALNGMPLRRARVVLDSFHRVCTRLGRGSVGQARPLLYYCHQRRLCRAVASRWKRSIGSRGNCFRATQRGGYQQHPRSYRFHADGILPLDLDPCCARRLPPYSFSRLETPGGPPLHPPTLLAGAVPYLRCLLYTSPSPRD